MNRFNISLGTWLKTPLILHWSWLLFMALVTFSNPYYGVIYFGIFFIIILHEFGHIYAGQHFGQVAQSVVVYPIGGLAHLGPFTNPKNEFIVALAGPFVNLLLTPILYLFSYLHEIFNTWMLLNIFIMVFNLLPVFPMDGGRVLRSCLSMFINPLLATNIAVRVSQFLCVLFIGIYTYVGNPIAIFIFCLMAIYAQHELNDVKHQVLLERAYDRFKPTKKSDF